MAHAHRIFLLFLIAVVLASCGSSAVAPANNVSLLSSTVDGLAHSVMQEQDIPGMTVAIAKSGTLLCSQGYGVSDLMTQQAMKPGVISEIGSITKQFTAALIMKLQEQGQLQVDDSIASYLPEYSFPPGITLRMMLTHTSGLADFTNFPPTWRLGAARSGGSDRAHGRERGAPGVPARQPVLVFEQQLLCAGHNR